jgi:hypothetical protein
MFSGFFQSGEVFEAEINRRGSEGLSKKPGEGGWLLV